MEDNALVARRDSGLAYVLWMGGLLGVCGLHRLYMGRFWSGLLWMFTGGLCMVGQLIDLFMMNRMIEDSNRGSGW